MLCENLLQNYEQWTRKEQVVCSGATDVTPKFPGRSPNPSPSSALLLCSTTCNNSVLPHQLTSKLLPLPFYSVFFLIYVPPTLLKAGVLWRPEVKNKLNSPAICATHTGLLLDVFA
jgi:hypothetical protein